MIDTIGLSEVGRENTIGRPEMILMKRKDALIKRRDENNERRDSIMASSYGE